MILGIISPFPSQIQSIISKLPPKYNFVHVTESDVLTAIGLGCLINSNKSRILDVLQETYGNVVISGSAMWDEASRTHLQELGGLWVCAEQLPDKSEIPQEQYWSLHDDTDLYRPEGSTIKTLLPTIRMRAAKDRKGVIHMAMEDVIQKAMQDLGIESSAEMMEVMDDPLPQAVPEAPVPVEVINESNVPAEMGDKTEATEVLSSPEQPTEQVLTSSPEVISTLEMSTAEKQNSDTSSSKSDLNVYLKIKDGTIALFLPTELQLPTQIVDGVEYQTLVFTAPDLGDVGLQLLQIQNIPMRQPSISNTVSEDVDHLQDLVAQKVQLDQAIKTARAAGDESTVQQLRKQRRSIRRQINAIGVMRNVSP